MTTADFVHYVKQIKLHEANATSTNDRNRYWTERAELRNYIPLSYARLEHG